MGLYEVPLSMSLLGFGKGTMLANFHMCGQWYYVGVKSSFQHAREGICVYDIYCLVCQDLVSYFYFGIFPLGTELW